MDNKAVNSITDSGIQENLATTRLICRWRKKEIDGAIIDGLVWNRYPKPEYALGQAKQYLLYQSSANFATKQLYVIIVLTLRVNTISRGWLGGYSLSGSEASESVQ